MRSRTLETIDFVKQVFIRSRGHGDIEDPDSQPIFVRPIDILDRNGQPIPQHTLQRCWERAVDDGYAFRWSKHVYGGGGRNRNVCAKYKLDRDRILRELGPALFEAPKPTMLDANEEIKPEMFVNGGGGEGKGKSLIWRVPVGLLASVNSAIEHPSSILTWDAYVKTYNGMRVIGGRMSSGNCAVRRKERAIACPHLFADGIAEHDIRSTVPAVVRLLNTGKWINAGQDLKTEIYEEAGLTLPKRRFKPILLTIMFTKSIAQAWNNFNHNTRNHETLRITRTEFERLGGIIDRKIGKNPWNGGIFYHESAIELLAIRNMQRRGKFAGSVYDCFFYGGMSESDVEACIADAANEYYENEFRPRLGRSAPRA